MIKFSEIIEASIEWAGTVLFRPFSPKKWLILGFVALMAGYTGGFHSSGSSHSDTEKPKSAEAAVYQPVESETLPGKSPTLSVIREGGTKDIASVKFEAKKIFQEIKQHLIITLFIALLILALMIIGTWLYARFYFVFLEDVVKNDASIKVPFKANKEIGNSLFKFHLVFGVVSLALLGLLIFGCVSALIKIGVFSEGAALGFKPIFFVCLPYVLLLLLYIIIIGVLFLFLRDFVTVIMFKEKIKFLAAWPKAVMLISLNKMVFIKYIFLNIGLGICSAIIYGVLSLVAMAGLILPVGLVAAVFYLIYSFIPVSFYFLYFIVLFIIAVPAALFLIYCFICSYLPIAVFFRVLGLKLIARLNPQYNLFNFTSIN